MASRQLQRGEKTPAILSVAPTLDQRLEIEFSSGSFLALNMRHCMLSNRHYKLNTAAVFGAVFTDGDAIIFLPNDPFTPDISPREAVGMALRRWYHDPIVFLRAEPLENSRIRLEMATGSTLLLNLKNHIRGGSYSSLQDEKLFRSVEVVGETLVFGDLQISEDELATLTLSTAGLDTN